MCCPNVSRNFIDKIWSKIFFWQNLSEISVDCQNVKENIMVIRILMTASLIDQWSGRNNLNFWYSESERKFLMSELEQKCLDCWNQSKKMCKYFDRQHQSEKLQWEISERQQFDCHNLSEKGYVCFKIVWNNFLQSELNRKIFIVRI